MNHLNPASHKFGNVRIGSSHLCPTETSDLSSADKLHHMRRKMEKGIVWKISDVGIIGGGGRVINSRVSA